MSEISDLKSADAINYSNDVFVWSLKKRIIRPISCTCAFSVIASDIRHQIDVRKMRPVGL